MIRRINFTGRKKILREDARVSVRSDPDDVLTFDASLNLVDYELPGDALVFVEAQRQTTFMRFPHGTVAAPQVPSDVSRRLTEFSTSDALLFRVKVTSAGERAGVLLAEADRIPVSDDAEQPDNRIPLLPPLGQDLGQETWRLDFSGTSGPQLLVNSRLGDWKAVAACPVFRSLVYPAAMRQVLWYVYKVEEVRDTDDPDAWQSRWLRFAASLPGVGTPPSESEDDDDWDEWITGAVDSFARQHEMADHFKREYERIREASA
jgi:hypothetical protein